MCNNVRNHIISFWWLLILKDKHINVISDTVDGIKSSHLCAWSIYLHARYLRTQQSPFLPRPTNIFRQRLQYAGLLKCFRRHTCMPSSLSVVLSTPAMHRQTRGKRRAGKEVTELIYHWSQHKTQSLALLHTCSMQKCPRLLIFSLALFFFLPICFSFSIFWLCVPGANDLIIEAANAGRKATDWQTGIEAVRR